jgi:MADS-box transcription enhancer factor 2
LQALNKKEHKNGTCSPDSPEPDTDYQLTPRTEAKYSKIDEEFQMMMQRNQLNGSRVCLYIIDTGTKYVRCFKALYEYFHNYGTQLYERN